MRFNISRYLEVADVVGFARSAIWGQIKMKSLGEYVSRIVTEESGQDLIEYALLAGLVGVGAVLSMKNLGTKISAAFNSIGTTLTTNV